MVRKITIFLFLVFAGCSVPLSEKSGENPQQSGDSLIQKTQETVGQCYNELLPVKVGST